MKHMKKMKKPSSGVVEGSEEMIGKRGNVMNQQSTEGGQLPFLPGANTYMGRMSPDKVMPGQSDTNTSSDIDFMPKKPK